MSLTNAMKTSLCEAYTDRVDSVSLHTGNPGTTGADDSAVPHEDLSAWSEPDDGLSTASASFDDLTGEYSWIGLWDGDTFVQGIPCTINYTAATDIVILVTHTVSEDA
jgi:hypothetical protein